MSVKMSVQYTGDLHCELKHGPSGTTIQTDAPKDNHGKGEAFSPTDLVGAALGSCILTTMAMVADRDGVSLKGARVELEKNMTTSPPRKIDSLPLLITLPASVPQEYRAKIEHIAHACPVHRSLHPDVKVPVEFKYE
jgi:putative redox protein